SIFFETRRPPRSPPFPYTTLFRSHLSRRASHGLDAAGARDPALWRRHPVRQSVSRLRNAFRRDEAHSRGSRRDQQLREGRRDPQDRKSTRLNSSHVKISYAVFSLK